MYGIITEGRLQDTSPWPWGTSNKIKCLHHSHLSVHLTWNNPFSLANEVYCKESFLTLNLPFKWTACIYYQCGEKTAAIFSTATFSVFEDCFTSSFSFLFYGLKNTFDLFFWVLSVLQALSSYFPSFLQQWVNSAQFVILCSIPAPRSFMQ